MSEKLQTENLTLGLYDAIGGVHLPAEDFINQYNPEEMQKGHCNIIGKIEKGDLAVAQFRIRDLIGCAGVIVFNDLYVLKSYQNRGIGAEVFDFVTDFAKYYGYGLIQATDITDNEYSKKIFVKKAWTHVVEFTNPKTLNRVSLWNLKLT